jgi:hypothetical protein
MSDEPFRVIVCGSRDWTDYGLFCSAMEEVGVMAQELRGRHPTIIVVHGACPFGGADSMADQWVADRARLGYRVSVERHPPKVRGTAGFHARNQDMANAGADICVGFTNGRDPVRGTWGTGDMFSRALAAGIPIRGIPKPKARP